MPEQQTDASEYVYKMVQLPEGISVRYDSGIEAANYLQGVVNDLGNRGWDFYRIDSFLVGENPGCLAALFGSKQQIRHHYVASFRRKRQDDARLTVVDD